MSLQDQLAALITLLGADIKALGALATVQDTPPALPHAKSLWYDSSTLSMFYQYDDGSSVQWVETGVAGAGGMAATEVSTPIVISGGIATMDCALGSFFTLDLSSNATLAIVNAPPADSLILQVTPSAGALLTLPVNAAMLNGSTYATGTAPHAIGLTTHDSGATFWAAAAQP